MRHRDYFSQTTVDITKDEVDLILDVDNIIVENSGIGPYEYWGARCYDKGIDYVADFRIRQVRDAHGEPFPDAENKALIAEIEKDDAMIEYILNDLGERLHDMTDGYDGDTDRSDE